MSPKIYNAQLNARERGKLLKSVVLFSSLNFLEEVTYISISFSNREIIATTPYLLMYFWDKPLQGVYAL